MSFKIITSPKLSNTSIFKVIKSDIESLIHFLKLKWNASPEITVKIDRRLDGAYLLSYSIDVNGNYFYLTTKGADLLLLIEKLKNNIFSI